MACRAKECWSEPLNISIIVFGFVTEKSETNMTKKFKSTKSNLVGKLVYIFCYVYYMFEIKKNFFS